MFVVLDTTVYTVVIVNYLRLGFQPEALLQDFVIDRSGTSHDMVVMSYDVDGLTDRVD
jgi:hypothetical protein